MLTGVHFLLSMTCNYECDHCFLYCSPRTRGTFTSEQLSEVFRQMDKIDSINSVYFEGGEPFLFYPVLLHGLNLAAQKGYSRGVVSNGYWANSKEDARLWLSPLAEIGVNNLSVSDDALHHGTEQGVRTKWVKKVADELGMPSSAICLEPPDLNRAKESKNDRGEPIVGGDIRFRGRAVDKLVKDLPRVDGSGFNSCPDEDFTNPGRVHLDPFGNVHLCQGIIMGNIWKTPLDKLIKEYDVNSHPICSRLHEGGPLKLAQEYGYHDQEGFVDPCHMCYETRKSILNDHPASLGPAMVYGQTFPYNPEY